MTAEFPKSQRLNVSNPASYSSPSVPISVYKQLAGELNVTKNQIAALKSENQQLRSNNQKLQNQVLQVIQAGEHLKQMVNRYDFGAESYQIAPPEQAAPPKEIAPVFPVPQLPESTPQPQQIAPATPAKIPSQKKKSNSPQRQATPTQSPKSAKPVQVKTVDPASRPNTTEEAEGGVNGWIIFIAAIAIVCTAFGAGYMVVLPLLNNNNSTAQ
jgi:cobalamin biosynthesis Mg chelatase CobN